MKLFLYEALALQELSHNAAAAIYRPRLVQFTSKHESEVHVNSMEQLEKCVKNTIKGARGTDLVKILTFFDICKLRMP